MTSETSTAPVDNRTTSGAATNEILSIRDLSVGYGGVAALSSVSVSVRERECVALIGPNGAGKSTLLNAISQLTGGRVSGQILFHGKPLPRRPDRIASVGIARSFQSPPLCDGESVLVNVMGGGHRSVGYSVLSQVLRPNAVRRKEQELEARAMEVLRIAGLEEHAHMPAGSLPYGKGKLVDISRALVARPDLLLLDEPTSGLDRGEQAMVRNLLKEMRSIREFAVVLVEHHFDLVRAIADRVVGLQAGSVLLDGTPEEVLDVEEFVGVISAADAEELLSEPNSGVSEE